MDYVGLDKPAKKQKSEGKALVMDYCAVRRRQNAMRRVCTEPLLCVFDSHWGQCGACRDM